MLRCSSLGNVRLDLTVASFCWNTRAFQIEKGQKGQKVGKARRKKPYHKSDTSKPRQTITLQDDVPSYICTDQKSRRYTDLRSRPHPLNPRKCSAFQTLHSAEATRPSGGHKPIDLILEDQLIERTQQIRPETLEIS